MSAHSDVNPANCLIKKVFEMGIVASNKKVLEINETYLPWLGPRGGENEADDATAAGGSGQGGESISAQPQKREEHDLERVGRTDRIQSHLCQQSVATTWATAQAREASIGSGYSLALTTTAAAVLRREGESGTHQDLENNGLRLWQAFAAGLTGVAPRTGTTQRATLRSPDKAEAVAGQCGHRRSPVTFGATQV